MDRSLLIASDTHISRDYGAQAALDLAELIRSSEDAEVILNGDILDLSFDASHIPPSESLERCLRPHRELIQVLSQHIRCGGKLTLVTGNHDAALSGSEAKEHLRRMLGAPDSRTVEISPWFVRRDKIHVEHGHLYDPDCAPNHPLAEANPCSEGLGTALMRRFVAPNDALFFAHANQTTLISGLTTAIRKWGPRAPSLIFNYFHLATKLCLETLTSRSTIRSEKSQGTNRVSEFAASNALSEEAVHSLIALAPRPTHHRLRDVFLRLYFDRVFAGLSLSSGISLFGVVALAPSLPWRPLVTATGSLLSIVGGGYLAQNIARHRNRYGHTVISQLSQAAQQVKQATGASLVVFGHTHVEVDAPGYCNLGSFGFPKRGRPYLRVSADGKPSRHHFIAT